VLTGVEGLVLVAKQLAASPQDHRTVAIDERADVEFAVHTVAVTPETTADVRRPKEFVGVRIRTRDARLEALRAPSRLRATIRENATTSAAGAKRSNLTEREGFSRASARGSQCTEKLQLRSSSSPSQPSLQSRRSTRACSASRQCPPTRSRSSTPATSG